MAHPDPTLANLQKRVATQNVHVYPAEIQAVLKNVPKFIDVTLQKKLQYAAANSITVALTDVETASLLNEIKANGG